MLGLSMREGDRAMAPKPLIALVDDDESVRESLPPLLRSFGFEVEAFDSARQLLEVSSIGRFGCLILDIGLPDMSGPELHRQLVRGGARIPVVYISARCDDEIGSALGEQQDVVAPLSKPFTAEAIIAAVRLALASTP